MTMSDPIADMIARIKNGNLVYKPFVDIPYSRIKEEISTVLKEEKYIKEYETIEEKNRKKLRVHLFYSAGKKRVITEIKRVSKPGVRIYVSKKEIPTVKNELGISILSTPNGILSSKKAVEIGVGGEVLFYIW